jgi:hypothetical protein
MTMKTISKNQAGVKVAVGIRAGGVNPNHNRKLTALAVKSGLKAGEGILHSNHSRRLA